ncbi:MAG: flavin monoamine oxidase family protein [Betaproteobacteria bacterium]
MRPTQYDVVVIGAGAAGLAAAADLARAGCSTLVMEARERIGGRCWSLPVPGVPVPVELGAEFIHGRPRATLSLIRDGASARVDALRKPWVVKAGRLEPRGDYFSEIQAAMNADRTLDRRDMSFDAYLERALQHRVSQEACVYARMLVQGYDAADPARASARAIVAEWTQAGASALSRPLAGYGPLLKQLYDKASAGTVKIQLHTVVRSVQWRRGFVDVAAESRGRIFRTTAARALITLPAGVLQAKAHSAGAVDFEPTLNGKRAALRRLGVGPVIKVALHFRSAFWETVDRGRYRHGTFFHCPGAAFPTFWNALPVRVPLLMAWAGGPHAERMAGATRADIVKRALNGLRRMFGKAVESHLAGAHLHDWQQDPYARGAYSYVMVGGEQARKALAATVANTLYFAGEATDVEGEAGTVAGALQSGRRAAREIIGGL